MPKTDVIPVRLSKEEQDTTEKKQKAYGFKSRSDVIRFALRELQLPDAGTR